MLKTPTHYTSKSPKTVILFVVLFSVVYLTMILQILPKVHTFNQGVNFLFAFLTICFFILSVVKDPGFIHNDGLSFSELIQTFDPMNLCPDC